VSAWKVIFATLVIFIAGAFTGGLLVTNTFNVLNSTHPAQAGQPHPAGNTNAVVQMGNPWLARSKNLLQRMDRELNLTPEQHQHMETLISNSQERTRELWKPIVPSMNKEFQFLRVEMRDQLTPEQQVQFDSFFKLRPGMDRRNNHGTNSPSIVQTNAPVAKS
jgi:Spy/CpxP family protein refolding chaperone